MFESFHTFVNDIITLIDPDKSLALVAGFKALITTWATIYIMYMGYMSLFGKVDNVVRELIYKLLILLFVGFFAFNLHGWYDIAIKTIQDLNTWISGGGALNVYKELDNGVVMISNLSELYFTKDTSTFELGASFATLIIYFSYFLVALTTAILLLLNMLSLQIIILLAPFAFLALMFPLVKGIFSRWIELIISNLFSIFFIALFFNIIFTKYKKIIAGLDPVTKTVGGLWDSKEVDFYMSAFTIFGFSVLAFILLLLALKYASALSSASIENAPKGAVMMAGALAYMAKATAKSTGKGVYSAGKGLAGAVKGVSGLSTIAGNKGSSAHKLLKKRGKAAQKERASGGKKS